MSRPACTSIKDRAGLFFSTDNLLHWAKSEIIGSAFNSFKECWSNGLSLVNSMHLCIRESRWPVFKVTEDRCWVFAFPLLQHSISMLSRAESWRAPFQGANQSLVFPTGRKLGQDSLLLRSGGFLHILYFPAEAKANTLF
jgi:hypothetical protein